MDNINYINHHKNVFAKIGKDADITSIDISIYNALFLYWNYSNFCETLSISRSEIMFLSKVGNANTYTKSLHRLHDKGYIIYKPSKSPLVGSKITVCRYDISGGKSGDISGANTGVNTYATTDGDTDGTLYKQYNRITEKQINKILTYFNSLDISKIESEINKLVKDGSKLPIEEKTFKQFSKEEFYDTLKPFSEKYSAKMLREFFDYWSEPMASKKMRLTKETAWDVSRRLSTWNNRNTKDYGNKNPRPISGKISANQYLAQKIREHSSGNSESRDNTIDIEAVNVR